MKLDFCVSHNYTQRSIILPLLLRPSSSIPPYLFLHLLQSHPYSPPKSSPPFILLHAILLPPSRTPPVPSYLLLPFILLPAILLLLLLPLYMYIHCFSELRIIILEQFFCQRLCKQGSNLQFHSFDYQVIQQKYHSENADVIESTLGVIHNTTKNLENIRKHQKKGRETPTSGLMTSLLMTLTGHATSGSHVVYAQWYILYYYYRPFYS